MPKVFSRELPHQRIHIGEANVKFRDGVAEVTDEVAEALLAIVSLGVTAEAVEPDAEDVSETVDEGAVVESAEPAEAVEPEKRKPGRPRKTDS